MTITGARVVVNSRSTRQRVLGAIRWYFREHGDAPSHGDIAALAGIAVKRVRGYAGELRALGYITYRAGVPRGIALVDRAAMLSDQELRLACVARGWVVTDSALPALAAAFPLVAQGDRDADGRQGVADWGLPSLRELDDRP